ncbi:SH3 domain-containing protein [Colletotrichum spinosum]|uniref:SH3 domain-containing protein n=1 Tax=Colletotrichum spinosum TaxID=1347390 RepID=A0A4V3HR30_9PEZI|nr:SH3 domain-containing protein [Colletotrichum spinosum]
MRPSTSQSSSSSSSSRRLSLSRTLSSLHKPSAPKPPKPPNRGIGAHIHKLTTRAGVPINKAVSFLGAEGFFPQTMPLECAKAARILHSFTDDSLPDPTPSKGPVHPLGLTRKSMVEIPPQVLANCSGLAIFNTLRAGAYLGSLAAGSGLVVARRPDGTWSPPSTFVISTLGAGFMIGLDIYDCVLVLNTAQQLAAFTHPRVSLGAESSVAIGPVGTGGAVEAALSKTARPMFSYIKSRGLWAGVQIDGTIVIARQDCNAVAYQDRRISAKKILTTQSKWPEGSQPLWEILMGIEGRYMLDPYYNIARQVALMGPPGDPDPPTGSLDEEDVPAPAYTSQAGSVRGEEGIVMVDDEGVEGEKQRLGRNGL